MGVGISIPGIKEVSQEEIAICSFSKNLADCVIVTHDNKILMQQRPQHWHTHAGALNIFGGHVEEGETISQALVRELNEELGAIVNLEDVIFIGAITEDETDHNELVHVYFWHDKEGTITGCYEAEDKRYGSITDALSHPKIMDYAKWALMKVETRGYLSLIKA